MWPALSEAADAETAGDLGRLVGEDVAEHVGRDDDVEPRGVADQQRRHRVDEALLAGHVGIALGDRARAGEEQTFGQPQHVGLVDHGDSLAPPCRERERRLDDARGAFARDLAHRQGEVGRRHELAGPDMHGAVGIEPFGVLAHDHEIDVAAAARRQARPRPRRPDVGEQVEPAAQLAGRIEAASATGGYSLWDTGPRMTPAACFACSTTASGVVVPQARSAAKPIRRSRKRGRA